MQQILMPLTFHTVIQVKKVIQVILKPRIMLSSPVIYDLLQNLCTFTLFASFLARA